MDTLHTHHYVPHSKLPYSSFKNVKTYHHEHHTSNACKIPKVVIPHLHHVCTKLSPHKSPHSYEEIKHYFPS